MKEFDSPLIGLVDLVDLNAKYAGDQMAFAIGDLAVNWRTFAQRTARIARAIERVGVKPDDVVAMVLHNRMEFIETMIAVLRAGAVLAPISPDLTAASIGRMVEDAGARLLVAEQLTCRAAHEGAACVRTRMLVDGSIDGWDSYQTSCEPADDQFPARPCTREARFNIMYSSGTTGAPKGIVHTHGARGDLIAMFIAHMKLDAGSVSLVTTPLHTNGSWCVLLPTIGIGGATVVLPKFNVPAFLDACRRFRPTYTLLVPTQLQMILTDPQFDPEALGCFRKVMCSGAPLPHAMKQALAEHLGEALIEIYGTTEGVAVARPPRVPAGKSRAVGLPMAGYDVRILGESAIENPPGKVGEIVGYGPSMMKRYHNQPQLTAEVMWLDERGRTYLRTGDLGFLDESGYLYLAGRKKDMIISGGQNVYAVDIEQVLLAHRDVAEAAVFAVPHPKWGESPAAAVVAKANRTIDPDLLRQWANEQLAKHQRLLAVKVYESLPRNAMGKVVKRELAIDLSG